MCIVHAVLCFLYGRFLSFIYSTCTKEDQLKMSEPYLINLPQKAIGFQLSQQYTTNTAVLKKMHNAHKKPVNLTMLIYTVTGACRYAYMCIHSGTLL